MWMADGIWLGRTTNAEWEADGAWLLGDRQPEGHPGRTTKLFYKSWVAHPARYGDDRYAFKARSDTAEWEYVQVFGGALECIVKEDAQERSLSVRHPNPVDIPPSAVRRWRLPSQSQVAYGATVLRRVAGHPVQPGWGLGYEIATWDEQQIDLLNGPALLKDYQFQFIEVFSGVLSGLDKALGHREHAFLGASVTSRWEAASPSLRGITIYF